MTRDKYSLGDDQPKRNPWQQDRLGFAPFARALANVVINMCIPAGYVMGLHGRWGSGKTTAINFILEYLKKHNQEVADDADKIEHIDFRPWIVTGHQDLISAFFKLLSESLGPREGRFQYWLKRRLKFFYGSTDQLVDAAATLAITIDPTGGAVSGVAGGMAKRSITTMLGRYLEDPSLQKAYEGLTEQLRASGRRFFVTIDDIDRLDDDGIKSIMQMVKTIGRLPNVMYLLAYDRDIVWRALDKASDPTRPKFVEKIVQQEIEIPFPSKRALLNILGEETAFMAGAGDDSPRWHRIVTDGVERWINYPRDVLRLSNGVKFAWPALEGEFDTQDLLAIEGIRLFDPQAFDWIRGNRDFLFNQGRYLVMADEARRRMWKN